VGGFGIGWGVWGLGIVCGGGWLLGRSEGVCGVRRGGGGVLFGGREGVGGLGPRPGGGGGLRRVWGCFCGVRGRRVLVGVLGFRG